MKKLMIVAMMFLLLGASSSGVFASSYANYNKNSIEEIESKLKKENVKTYYFGEKDLKLINKENTKTISSLVKAEISEGDSVVFDEVLYNELFENGYIDQLVSEFALINIFFVGNDNIDVVLKYFDLDKNVEDSKDIYMVSYTCISEGCYPIIYINEEDVSDDVIGRKITKEQYISRFNKEFYPDGKKRTKPGSVGAFDTSNNWTTDYNYWYISSDWFATDIFLTSSKGTSYGDYREWTQVLLVKDLEVNQKEYVAVNKKGHMIPDNSDGGNDFRSYHLKPQTSVTQGHSTFKLFDYMPKNEPTTDTYTISQGSTMTTDGPEPFYSVSYNVEVSDLSVDQDGTNSIQGIFSPDFEWSRAYTNNLSYNEEETVNCWGYIVQLDSTYTEGVYYHWHDVTNVKFLRDLVFKNYYLNDDSSTIVGFRIPTRDSNGLIIN